MGLELHPGGYAEMIKLLEKELEDIPKDTKLRILEIGPSFAAESLPGLKEYFKDWHIEWVGVTKNLPELKKVVEHQRQGIQIHLKNVQNPDIKELGKFDFILSNNVFTKLGIRTSFLPSGLMSTLLQSDRRKEVEDAINVSKGFNERLPGLSEAMHKNIFEILKDGGKAIHTYDKEEEPLKPRDVPYRHESMAETHMVLKKPKKKIA